MYPKIYGHKLFDPDAFTYRWDFRNARDPVPPMSFVLQFLTVPQVQMDGASRIQNSQAGDGGDAYNRKSTNKIKSLQNYEEDESENEYTDSEERSKNSNNDDDDDPDYNEFIVFGDNEILERQICSYFPYNYLLTFCSLSNLLTIKV